MTKETDSIEKKIEKLTGLYKKDPAEFEELRKELITNTIEAFPAQHKKRAYGLQFVLDARLSKYKDPVVRMNKMVEIFWEQFGLFQEVLKNPGKVVAEKERCKKETLIIPFRKKEAPLLQKSNKY